MSKNYESQEMILSLSWQKKKIEDTGDKTIPESLSLSENRTMAQNITFFITNEHNMTLQVDLWQTTEPPKASMLWGPDGAWASEVHHLDLESEDFAGGSFHANSSEDFWVTDVSVPWGFLPPNITRIQV